jgi:hypothetical protein
MPVNDSYNAWNPTDSAPSVPAIYLGCKRPCHGLIRVGSAIDERLAEVRQLGPCLCLASETSTVTMLTKTVTDILNSMTLECQHSGDLPADALGLWCC